MKFLTFRTIGRVKSPQIVKKWAARPLGRHGSEEARALGQIVELELGEEEGSYFIVCMLVLVGGSNWY